MKTEQSKIKCFNKTNYPKIFQNVYWGGHMHDTKSIITEDQYKNRNEFVQEFGISRQKDLPYKLESKLVKEGFIVPGGNPILDHEECYYTEKESEKYILIYSPYCTAEDKDYEKIIEFYNNFGFNVYKSLYAKNATTFIRIFDRNSNELIEKEWTRKPHDIWKDDRIEDLFLCHNCNSWYPWFNYCKGAQLAIHKKIHECNETYRYMNDEHDRRCKKWACDLCIEQLLEEKNMIIIDE